MRPIWARRRDAAAFHLGTPSRDSGSQQTCMGLFLSSDCFWVFLTVLCSERERPFFVPSPAIRFPERAEGVKGPKRLAELGGVPP